MRFSYCLVAGVLFPLFCFLFLQLSFLGAHMVLYMITMVTAPIAIPPINPPTTPPIVPPIFDAVYGALVALHFGTSAG